MASKKTKKYSAVEQEYNKELKRINRFIKRAEKRGYLFFVNAVPKKPKRITKASVNRLKKIKPDVLYKKSVYGGEATSGEIVRGEIGRHAERSLSSKKAHQTIKYKAGIPTQESTNTEGFEVPENISNDTSFFDKVTITNYRGMIRPVNQYAHDLLTAWLDNIIAKHGEHKTAVMLNKGAENGVLLSYKVLYDKDKLHQYIAEMLNYLPEVTTEFKAEIMDALEEEEGYSSPQ